MEIGTEAAQFPEKEYIYGIFLSVYPSKNMFFLYIILKLMHSFTHNKDGLCLPIKCGLLIESIFQKESFVMQINYTVYSTTTIMQL